VNHLNFSEVRNVDDDDDDDANKAAIHSQSKPPCPQYTKNMSLKTKNGLDKGSNKGRYTVLYEL
jgi:hypothetical protein